MLLSVLLEQATKIEYGMLQEHNDSLRDQADEDSAGMILDQRNSRTIVVLITCDGSSVR